MWVLVMVQAGVGPLGLIVKVSPLLTRSPGGFSNTVTVTAESPVVWRSASPLRDCICPPVGLAAALAMSDAGTSASSSVPLTGTVANAAPFHRTTSVFKKPVPRTFSVNAGPPAAAFEGFRPVMTGARTVSEAHPDIAATRSSSATARTAQFVQDPLFFMTIPPHTPAIPVHFAGAPKTENMTPKDASFK
jgi:hypothetical protein